MKRVRTMALVIAMSMTLGTGTAWAGEGSFWDDLKLAGAAAYEDVRKKAPGIYESAKEKAGEVAGYIVEKAPEVGQAAKKKAGEAYDYLAEKAPEVGKKVKKKAGQAAEAVQDFRQEQEDEFRDWFEQQTGTTVGNRAYNPIQSSATFTADSETMIWDADDPDAGYHEDERIVFKDGTTANEEAENVEEDLESQAIESTEEVGMQPLADNAKVAKGEDLTLAKIMGGLLVGMAILFYLLISRVTRRRRRY